MDAPAAYRNGKLALGFGDAPSLRWVAADLTGPVQEACGRLDLSPLAAGAMGRCLTGAALLYEMLSSNAERLVVAVSGSGPLEHVLAEIDHSGRLRGMVSTPRVEVPLASSSELGVRRALGDGVLTVLQTEGGTTRQSRVELRRGGLSESLAHFLEHCEGMRTAFVLGVLTEANGVSAAGGMALEVLPGTDGTALTRLEKRLSAVSGMARTLSSQGLDGMVETILDPGLYRQVASRRLAYACRCSRPRIHRHLRSLGESSLEEMRLDDGTVEAQCVFCGSRYRFQAAELVA